MTMMMESGAGEVNSGVDILKRFERKFANVLGHENQKVSDTRSVFLLKPVVPGRTSIRARDYLKAHRYFDRLIGVLRSNEPIGHRTISSNHETIHEL